MDRGLKMFTSVAPVKLNRVTRRQFCVSAAGALASAHVAQRATGAPKETPRRFQLNYILSAAMYGTMPLADVIAEASKTGAENIDVWPMPHGNHREQIDDMGLDKAEALLKKHKVQLGAITRYDLGPYELKQEFPLMKRFGGKVIVCGATPQAGDSEKERVRKFLESMKPHVADAEEAGIRIGIENHGSTILDTPSSVRYFAEFSTSPSLGIAMAPYHLPQDTKVIAKLIEDLNDKLVLFQAWEHGMGCMEKLPKEQELMQMPGRGKLDFVPILSALKKINYQGWTEIFMHPVPRGVPILDTASAVTGEINRSRKYLDQCLTQLSS
jgi:sugar phosphate isomerase/epimerase